MNNSANVLYIARYGWLWRILSIASTCIFAYFLPYIDQYWHSEGWIIGLGFIACCLMVTLVLGDIFIRKTVFTEAGIYQRSRFGSSRFFTYQQLQELIIEYEDALIIKNKNGQRIKVFEKEGNSEKIIKVIKPFLNSDIRIIEK